MLGVRGEELACRVFRRLGFEVVERNYRCRAGEIDLIAARGPLVVFCEVKTRRTDRYGEPSEAVTHLKRARLRRAAASWLAERKPRTKEVRFDVVSVIVRGARAEVTHIPNAF